MYSGFFFSFKHFSFLLVELHDSPLAQPFCLLIVNHTHAVLCLEDKLKAAPLMPFTELFPLLYPCFPPPQLFSPLFPTPSSPFPPSAPPPLSPQIASILISESSQVPLACYLHPDPWRQRGTRNIRTDKGFSISKCSFSCQREIIFTNLNSQSTFVTQGTYCTLSSVPIPFIDTKSCMDSLFCKI